MSRIIKQIQINTLPPVAINNLCLAAADDDKKPVCEPEAPLVSQSDAILLIQQEAANSIALAKRELEEKSAAIYKDSQEAGFAAGYKESFAKGYEEGTSQGHSEGYITGEQAAKSQMESSIRKATEEATQILTIANRQAQQTILSAERQIVEIALAVAEKILAYELDANSQAVVSVVKTALDKVRNQEHITVRVNPSDYASVIAAKSDLDAILQREQSIEFAADQTVSRGGCVIDSDFGSADARIETQLQALQATIRSLLT